MSILKCNKVSIIIPVYNTEMYLRKTIDSILNQTYRNIEVILINDGSTDNSGKICDEYVEKDRRIKGIHKNNSGVSASRNLGIDMATGVYIQFVDSDDYIEPKMTERLVEALYGEVDLVISSFKKEFRSGDKKIIRNHLCPIEGLYEKKEFMMNFGELFNNGFINSMCNKIYMTDILKEHNLKCVDELSMGEDLLFNLQYLNVSKCISIVKEPLYNYVKFNFNSITASVKKEFFLNQQMLFEKVRQFLFENNSSNERNLNFIEISYTDSIINCFENIFHMDANFTSKDRKLNICEIVYDDCVRRNIVYFKSGGGQKYCIGFLINHKSIHGIYFFFIIKKSLRNNFSPLFRFLKKRLETGT